MGVVLRATYTIYMYENELFPLENIKANQYAKIWLLICAFKTKNLKLYLS